MTYATPSAAIEAGACPMCLGDGETFHILDDLAPCSGCAGTGLLADLLRPSPRRLMSTIVDGRCDRCDEREDVCQCPSTTIAVRELDRNAVHVRLSMFVGVPGSRRLAGELVLSPAEWDDLQWCRMRSGWLLIPIEVLDA